MAYITGDLADCLDDKGRMQTFARVAGPNSGIVTTSICRVAWVMIHAERWLLLIKAMGRELPLKRDQRRA